MKIRFQAEKMDVLVGCFISLYGLFDFDVQNPTQRKN